MAQNTASIDSRVYRVDKFRVPDYARQEFVERVQSTHETLRTQPGFRQDWVLEQHSGPGEFNIVTIVEWENVEAIPNARVAVQALHQRMNFDPHAMYTRLGITADLGYYERIAE
jgi:heme-degrading monooxygenase HmoA